MLESLGYIEGIEVLLGAVLVVFGLFHFLLFREYAQWRKAQNQQLSQLEDLVKQELAKTQKNISMQDSWLRARQESEEKLGLIRILIEILQKKV